MLKRITAAAICGLLLTMVLGPAPKADAGGIVFGFPDYFPPFAETGRIIEIGVLDDGDAPTGETCTVFQADSNGALFFFNGVKKYEVGTHMFVMGNSCTICLVHTTCGFPVSPILNAEVTLFRR